MRGKATEGLAMVKVNPNTQEIRIRELMEPDSPGELRVLFDRVNEV